MLTDLEKELDLWGAELITRVKLNLLEEDMEVSGVLYDSVDYLIEPTPTGFVLEYYMVEYGYYQDEGVKGKVPSAVMVNDAPGRQKAPNSRFKFGSGKGKKGGLFKGLDKWVIKRNLAPRKNGKFQSRSAIKHAITKSIYYQGLEPRRFFTRAWNQSLQGVDENMARAMANSVERYFITLL